MKILITLACAVCFSGIATAATQEDDVNRYAQIFSSSQNFDQHAVEALAWMGVSDPRVFDVVERRVLAGVAQGLTDKHTKTEIGLSIRALGFSGQPKYRDTLLQISADRVYGRYAKAALEDLPDYQKWNPLLSNRANFDPKYSDDVNRVLIMLRSDDFELKKIGAKRIYFQNKDEVLLDALTEQIRTHYKYSNEQRSDTIAWMVKALGSAKQAKYRPVLEEVVTFATDRKVVKYAKEGLEKY